jgi:hypothetical protein
VPIKEAGSISSSALHPKVQLMQSTGETLVLAICPVRLWYADQAAEAAHEKRNVITGQLSCHGSSESQTPKYRNEAI